MCTNHVMGQELIYLVLSLEPPHCSSDYQPLLEQFDILHLFFAFVEISLQALTDNVILIQSRWN